MVTCRRKGIASPLATKLEQAVFELPIADKLIAVTATAFLLIAAYFLGFVTPWLVLVPLEQPSNWLCRSDRDTLGVETQACDCQNENR